MPLGANRMDDAFQEIMRENRIARAALRATIGHTQKICDDMRTCSENTPRTPSVRILMIVEGLIIAHKAAKVDDDGYTLDLIEDALFHVGKRLAKECPDGRRYSGRSQTVG